MVTFKCDKQYVENRKVLHQADPSAPNSDLISTRIPFLFLHRFLGLCETSAHVILPQNIDRWTVRVS